MYNVSLHSLSVCGFPIQGTNKDFGHEVTKKMPLGQKSRWTYRRFGGRQFPLRVGGLLKLERLDWT